MIVAGIVTYNPDIDKLRRNYSRYIDEAEVVYIYDNASDNIAQIEALAKEDRIELIKGEENKGIAYALNRIMSCAKELGADWVLTMDQDSECQEGIISALGAYCDENIGIICPYLVERGGSRKYSAKDKTEYVARCITSGSLTGVDVWEKLGGFDEWMFIDIVDFEYCARVIEAGYKILRVNTVFIYQEIGQLQERIIGKRHIYIRNHSPIRKYYFARNILYCNYIHPNTFCWTYAADGLLTTYLKTILFEQGKSKKISAMNRGVWDARAKIKELKRNQKNRHENATGVEYE